MRPLSLAALLAGVAVFAALARPPAWDHYNPDALYRAALESARVGDVETACILLRRAARLAPHDARVVAALRELEAGATELPALPETLAAPVPPASPPVVPAEPPPPASLPVVPAEPPPPWPPR